MGRYGGGDRVVGAGGGVVVVVVGGHGHPLGLQIHVVVEIVRGLVLVV